MPKSAKSALGLDLLLGELKALSMESPQLFPDGMISDQPEKQLFSEIIREKLLHNLDKEIPHGIAVEIERFSARSDGLCEISSVIVCEKKSHQGIIIGKQGTLLTSCVSAARQ